nr:trehalase-like [Onthophagus taurus]
MLRAFSGFLRNFTKIQCRFLHDNPKSTTWKSAACGSPIYCYGKLLTTIQNSRIFHDSKTFVDMKMRRTVFETVGAFNLLMTQYDDSPSREVLESYVRDYFEQESELEDWFPLDFMPEPKFLDTIRDPEMNNFAKHLVWLWPKLGRKLKQEVHLSPEQYSLIPLSNGIIIPGGRSREIYYWDTYWIINGLLISEMYETARGLIDNLIYTVKIYGFVPHGGRIYYAQRSQPPLLTCMAANYIRYTNDVDWLRSNILFLKRELKHWRSKRMIPIEVNLHTYNMAHYAIEGHGPRPESFHDDVEITSHLETEKEKEEVYINIKSAVQSGWTFSSRWIYDEEGDSKASLSHTQTTLIIPVDLNAFIHKAFSDMSYLFGKLGNVERQVYWQEKADDIAFAIDKVLFDQKDLTWYDYNIKLRAHRKKFYASNFTPLWTGAYKKEDTAKVAKGTVDYITKMGLLDYKGGMPTSLEYSGQEWDFPNAWPPLQAILVQGLERTGQPEAQIMAKQMATRWVHANLQGYNESGVMYEKYNCVEAGKYGTGEYIPQVGFGWSNSVVLEFILQYYGKPMNLEPAQPAVEETSPSGDSTSLAGPPGPQILPNTQEIPKLPKEPSSDPPKLEPSQSDPTKSN